MKKYSSTLAGMFSGNCPAALGHYENKTPCDTDFYQTGIAAHAVLEVVAQKKASDPDSQKNIGDAVARELITTGRSFGGEPEPPINPMHAIEGRDLALRWLSWNEIPEGAIAEGGFGITSEGKACAWSADDCRYSAILDLLYFETMGDEEYGLKVVAVRDYKSAWPTNDDDLDTLQRRGQAVVAYRKYGDKVQGIKLEVVNLRTGATFDRVIILDDDGIALLEQWEKDCLMICKAMDATREPRPGAGCLSCKYTLGCESCLTYYKDSGENAAISFATIHAVNKQLGEVMRARSKDHKFHMNAGYVGYREMQKKVLKKDAIKLIAEHWCSCENEEISAFVRGLLRAGDITPTIVTNIIDVLYPNKKDASRLELIDQCIGTVIDKRFGVHKS